MSSKDTQVITAEIRKLYREEISKVMFKTVVEARFQQPLPTSYTKIVLYPTRSFLGACVNFTVTLTSVVFGQSFEEIFCTSLFFRNTTVTRKINQASESNDFWINSLQPGVAFLYPLKTSENLLSFLMFSGSIDKQHQAVKD